VRDTIEVIGARTHNLKNVHLEMPRNQLIVFTGVSGSGKSSLAFGKQGQESARQRRNNRLCVKKNAQSRNRRKIYPI
jgi:excinuclease UvrABC ATPase subunit